MSEQRSNPRKTRRNEEDGNPRIDRSPGTSDPGPGLPGAAHLSVVLVREWEQQMSSSGCCGRFEGDLLDLIPEGDPAFADRREKMECAGRVYRSLRDSYGVGVEIQVVDPRNLISLIPILWSQGRRFGLTIAERLLQLARISVNMVVVNGRVVSRNRWPDPDEVLDEAARALGRGASTNGEGIVEQALT